MKKTLAILLTVCLIAVTMSVGIFPVSAQGKDTETELIPIQEGPDITDYETISLGETKTAVISEAGTTADFTFTPEKDGIYLLGAVSQSDTYGYLYEEDFTPLGEDDDGGDGMDFMFAYQMTAGDTYILSAKFLDDEEIGEFEVYVKESPIKSIKIDDVSIIEKTNGWETFDEDSNLFFYYQYGIDSYTVTLTDGTTIDSDQWGYVEIEGSYYSPNIKYDGQNENHWTVGNSYPVTATILGISGTFNVTIIESPVKKVEIEDISLLEEGLGGYLIDTDQQEYFYYAYSAPAYKVTLAGGEVLESDEFGYVTVNGSEYSLDLEDEQFTDHWEAGNTYTATGTVLGVSGNFGVTIEETPIKSLEINDISIMENTSGFSTSSEDGEIYFNYYIEPTYTVTLKNDEVIESDIEGEVEINGEYYSLVVFDTQTEVHWESGKTYAVTGKILGVTDEFNVTITENPIKSVEVDDITLFENGNGIVLNYDGETAPFYYIYKPTYRINLKDGSVCTPDEEGFVEIGGERFYMIYVDYQEMQPWQVGNTYNVFGILAGETLGSFEDSPVMFSVTISDKPAEDTAVVSVEFTSFESGENMAIIALYDETGEKMEDGRLFIGEEAISNYDLESNQNYLIRAYKDNHATMEIPVELGTEDITIEANLRLRGDLTGDGAANRKDMLIMQKHILNACLTGYDLAVGDLNDDTFVNRKDIKLLQGHIFHPESQSIYK